MDTAGALKTAEQSPYDSALEVLSEYGPYLTNGFALHAPMVVEALETMGRAEAIGPWLETELPNLTHAPQTALFVNPEKWETYLGYRKAYTAWVRFFEEAIWEEGWRPVVGKWVERLQAGYVADATHGIIRVGHITRALERGETPERLNECARALAYWASCFNKPSFVQDGGSGTHLARDMLNSLSLVPDAKRNNGGAITVALESVAHSEGFASKIADIDLSGDQEARALELARMFADLFLMSATTPLTGIVFTHALTSLAAALNLAPIVSQDVRAKLLRRAWETGAAMHVVYSTKPEVDRASASEKPSREELIDHAVQHGDDHVIKLTEACLGFHERSVDPMFLQVTEKARELAPARR